MLFIINIIAQNIKLKCRAKILIKQNCVQRVKNGSKRLIKTKNQ